MKTLPILSITTFFFVLLTFTSCNKGSCEEREKKNCICTMEYSPVCGCNDKTYGNACSAECNGITDYTPGECK